MVHLEVMRHAASCVQVAQPAMLYWHMLCFQIPPCLPTVNSVLAIGGVGGLAIGLAGREILENLFTGLIILSSSPFEVGEEVLFTPPSGPVGAPSLPAVLLTSPV